MGKFAFYEFEMNCEVMVFVEYLITNEENSIMIGDENQCHIQGFINDPSIGWDTKREKNYGKRKDFLFAVDSYDELIEKYPEYIA